MKTKIDVAAVVVIDGIPVVDADKLRERFEEFLKMHLYNGKGEKEPDHLRALVTYTQNSMTDTGTNVHAQDEAPAIEDVLGQIFGGSVHRADRDY
jgi:hypothetical protein